MYANFSLSNLTGSLGKTGLGSNSTISDVMDLYGKNCVNKRYLITGITSGIGKQSAISLACSGAKLVLVIRPSSNADDIIQQLRDIRKKFCKDHSTKYDDDDIRVERYDVAVIGKIRDLVESLPRDYLDGLLLNAGVMAVMEKTYNAPEKRELQWATNFLYPCTLAKLCVEEAILADHGRVVFVNSLAHLGAYADCRDGPIRMNDLLGFEHYDGWSAYGQSKLAQVLFTKMWVKRDLSTLPINADRSASVFLVHPGVIMTKLGRHLPSFIQSVFGWISPFAKTVEQGASTQLTALLAPLAKLPASGSYMADCNESECTDFVNSHIELGPPLLKMVDDLTSPLFIGGRAGNSPVRQAMKQRISNSSPVRVE